MRFIDVHIHLGRLMADRPGLSVRTLLRWMDAHGIERALVLAIENPEETYFYVTTEQVLRWCRAHKDRLSAYCNIDPRRGLHRARDFRPILEDYVARGCVGFGEMLAGLPLNDPRLKQIYAICGELGLPVMLHIGPPGGIDRIGLPFLEQICREFPETNFIGHGQWFWSEISAAVSPRTRGGYPRTAVKPGGRLDTLLAAYPNLYADISAGSGYNALTRSPAFGYAFVRRHRRKILFGTDYLAPGQHVPQFAWFASAPLPGHVKEAIGRGNAKRLFGL